jgi:hypothetical protein
VLGIVRRERVAQNGTKGESCSEWNEGRKLLRMERREKVAQNGTKGESCRSTRAPSSVLRQWIWFSRLSRLEERGLTIYQKDEGEL